MIKKTSKTTVEEKKEEVKNKPVAKFRSGTITATIWGNENTNKDGQKFESYSFNIERGYKNKESEWNNTTSLRKQDVANIIALLSKVTEYLYIDEDEETEKE